MGKQLVTDIVINLAGNFANKARQYGQSMTQFAANNQRAMNMLKMSASAAGRGIDAMGSRYVALGAAVAGGATVKGYAELDRRISRIAIAADISRDKAKELKDEINAVSNTKGLRIDPSEATAAVEEILTKTGDLEYAIANLPNIAAVIQATGAGGTEVGGIFTEFKKLAIDSSEAAMRAIDTLNLQGKSGAFTLGNMAKEGPKIFAAYAATGRQGAAAVTELGAALQVIRQGVGSDAEAVTAFESIIRDLTRPDTVKKLKQLGNIDVFDPEQLKQGKEVMRSLPALIEEIVTKSGGLSSKLADLNLTDEAKRALKPVIAEFVQTGDVKAFDEFLTLSGDGTTTLNDAAVAASDFAASLQLVSNSWSQFANQQLAEPIAELADAINSLEPDAVQNWLETGKNIALVVGGLVAVKKGIDAVKWTKGVWDAAKPGKGGAFVRYKTRDIKSGRVVENTCNAGTKFESVMLTTREFQYLYNDGADYIFMDNETYEQVPVPEDMVGENSKWLRENDICQLLFADDELMGVTPPMFIETTIVQTDPGFKGDTVQGSTKPATIDTGAVIQVPMYLNEGEVIKVDTRDGKFVSRV